MARRLTWLGQAGFRLGIDGIELVVDPWVSPHENRLVPPPPLALAAEGLDWVLVTHEHFDHLDLEFLPIVIERSPTARVVLPAPLLPLVAGIVAPDRLVAVEPYDTVDLGGVEAHVVPSFHGVTMDDAYGDGSAVGGSPRFVGYVLGADRSIYHAGDTVVTDELTDALRELGVDVALLPVNGRDAAREAQGIVGNMNAVEAVELALAIGATRVVAYHWDGFAGNTAPPGAVADAAAGRIHVVLPAHFLAFDL
jgi:L-ascorbate metabolism protein UlaG (beta-lactamase superfamily)